MRSPETLESEKSSLENNYAFMKYSDTNFTVPALVLSFRFVIIKYLSGFVTYYRAFHTEVILSMHIMMEKRINVSLSVSLRIRRKREFDFYCSAAFKKFSFLLAQKSHENTSFNGRHCKR